MKNFWKQLDKPYFVMAPMAGYTDMPFRIMCKHFGADIVVSEMISSEALWYNRLNSKSKTLNTKQIQNSNYKNNKQLLKTLELIRFAKIERPYIVQIFGSDPEKMTMSAEYIATGKWYKDYLKITKYKLQNTNKSEIKNTNDQNSLKTENCKLKIESIPDGIDVNMGCPARDVVKTGAGVALMKDVRNAQDIVHSIKKKVKNIPVSVKTRLGWAKKDEILDFSRYMEDAGVDALIVHGRTFKGGFSAPVDWDMIKRVKSKVSIPVIGNGSVGMNIKERIMNYGLDGYMVGRGAIGRPWLFEELKKQFLISNSKFLNKSQCSNDQIYKTKLSKIILEHGELMYEHKGKWGIREFRKHFLGYLKGVEDGKKLKKEAVRVETIEDIRKICKNMI